MKYNQNMLKWNGLLDVPRLIPPETLFSILLSGFSKNLNYYI